MTDCCSPGRYVHGQDIFKTLFQSPNHEHGNWTHPALNRSGCETPAELAYWLRSHGLLCFVMTMCDEAPEAFAAGFTDKTPDDDGLFLESVHDTCYGPAVFE
ncbi:hypothetical protein V4841_21910 [Lelliottia amnigena]|uniref:Uncharacterized protein n=1 Tax=Lelliottia amnigena TaxID=61646 RepID=A0ABU7UGQ0_LELAM|nr:hypothetical protein [Enterobacter sp. 166D1]